MSNSYLTFATFVANKNIHSPHFLRHFNKKVWNQIKTLITRPFSQKLTNLNVFRKKSIRHINMAIRHMWRVANGLDNAGLNAP